MFDRQPGSGYAVRAYERADAWLAAAADRIAECSCDGGCPGCILTPGCGSSRPLDKPTCRRLLDTLTTPSKVSEPGQESGAEQRAGRSVTLGRNPR